MKKLLVILVGLVSFFQEIMESEAGLISYGNKFVDEKYSPIAEENLYYDAIFVAGITFTDKYQEGEMGKLLVHKPGKSTVVVGQPAQDFSDIDVADSLITITLNNSFRQSRKIYQVAANAVRFDLAVEEFESAMLDVQESWQISATAALVDGGTGVVDITAITSTNIKEKIVDFRKTLRDAKARANVVLHNTTSYAAMLLAAGAEFTPARNERINETGEVGRWLGMLHVECQQLNESAAKVYDNAGVLQTIDLTEVDFIMYDYRAFSILDNLNAMRIKDTEDFVGSKAQVEINSGFQVTNSLRVIYKDNTA